MSHHPALDPKLGPRQIVYQDIYQHIYTVTADFGSFTKDYIVRDPGQRAGMVAISEGSVLLVRQYRLLINGLSWEIPGGHVDEGESPETAASRECLEETGILCLDIKPLLSFHGGLDTVHNPSHLYYATRHIVKETPEPNPREVVLHEWIPLPKCVDMIAAKEIQDSFSIVAILLYRTLIDG